jgi:hypothetical protein
MMTAEKDSYTFHDTDYGPIALIRRTGLQRPAAMALMAARHPPKSSERL